MRTILGIDQSYTSSGYCLIADTGAVLAFGQLKSDKTLDTYTRALNVALSICQLIELHTPSQVNIEGLAFGIRGDATRDLAGLLFTIINVIKLQHPSINVEIFAPTSIKKLATGSGKADKSAMINALPDDFRKSVLDKGFKKTTGLADIADSYWIANMALKQSV